MNKVRNKKIKTKSIKKKQSGQALTEYTVLLVVATMIALALTNSFIRITRTGMSVFAAVLERDLRTGNFPEAVSLWQN